MSGIPMRRIIVATSQFMGKDDILAPLGVHCWMPPGASYLVKDQNDWTPILEIGPEGWLSQEFTYFRRPNGTTHLVIKAVSLEEARHKVQFCLDRNIDIPAAHTFSYIRTWNELAALEAIGPEPAQGTEEWTEWRSNLRFWASTVRV